MADATSLEVGPGAKHKATPPGLQYCSFSTLPNLNGPLQPYGWTKTTGSCNTISKVAARLGYPQLADLLLTINSKVKLKNGHYLRDARQQLKPGTKIRIPNFLTGGLHFRALFQDGQGPIITAGYAKFDTVDRPGRFGLSRFLGYDPFQMTIAIQFESWATQDGTAIERAIAKMESMAGVTPGKQRITAPSVIRVFTTDPQGREIPVVPRNWQQSPANPTAPAWNIDGIAWAGGDLRDNAGQRIRSLCTLTLQQYTPMSIATASATQRNRATSPDN